MPKLYDLTGDILKLESMMEEATDLDDEAMAEAVAEALSEQGEALNEKVRGIIGLMRNWKATAEMIHAEEKRLADRRKAYDNRQKRLSELLLFHMQRLEKQKMETDIGTVSIRKGVESVVVNDELQLPQGYFEMVTTVQPDKAALKKLWKETPEDQRAELEKSFRVERGNPILMLR